MSALFSRYGLNTVSVAKEEPIPGSFWGDSEAGLIANELYIRDDTPIHSAFHEACHYICMDQKRRTGLHTNAGGDVHEENAVCYLQILLANQLDGYSSDCMMQDMDNWGYSFRLGSAAAWFEKDAEDAREWLLHAQLITQDNQTTWKLRT
ncbi:hypothetical protein BOW52_02215 [Solemya elarraichensis gill symbiont]|uniref:IrrE N-terminal-like domain-containing protein n=1 Tax=Solemya elarraichensis gill symbiont TaxID=1918949 RepID=A0A1T2LC85_9GAMM|nr:hypothetical protein [Solemya elarraichensis gill symbiont]OOZ42654.1 hypothetical protein BOW52_02215 [Solemya elarraichensis gill symbiont]